MGKKKKARAKKTSTKKRKEKRVKKKKRGMTKFSFVTQPRHFVLHIPNTPPHHHLLLSKKKIKKKEKRKQKKIRLRKKIIDEREKNPNLRKTARNARPILYDSEHQL